MSPLWDYNSVSSFMSCMLFKEPYKYIFNLLGFTCGTFMFYNSDLGQVPLLSEFLRLPSRCANFSQILKKIKRKRKCKFMFPPTTELNILGSGSLRETVDHANSPVRCH